MDQSELIGRATEIEEATKRLRDSANGPASAIVIGGEPGIGKTELARHIDTLAANISWTTITIECRALSFESSFAPVRRLCTELQLSGALELLDQVSPDDDPGARERLFQAVTSELRDTLSGRRLLLILDDVHLSDESSKVLVSHVFGQLDRQPLVLVLSGDTEAMRASRPLAGMMSGLIRENRCSFLHLQGLGEASCASLIEQVSGRRPEPDETRRLVEQTGGNPFLLTQFAASGRLTEDLSAQSSITVPPGVRFAVLASLDNLEPVTYRVLSTAALIGETVSIEDLGQAVPGADFRHVVDALDKAAHLGVLSRRNPGDQFIQFSHALARELLIQEIPAAERLATLEKIVRSFEQRHAHELEEHASYLAKQYGELGPIVGWEKCVEYSILAGRRAMRLYAYEDAIVWFEGALARCREQDQNRLTAELLRNLAEAELHIAREFEERRRGFMRQQQAYGMFRTLGDHESALETAAIGEGTLAGMAWNLDFLRSAIEATPRELRNGPEYCRLCSRVGLAEGILRGDRVAAERYLEEAMDLADRLARPELKMDVAANTASVLGFWHMDHEVGLQLGARVVDDVEPVNKPLRAFADHAALMIRVADPRASDSCERLEREAVDRNDPTFISVWAASRTMWDLLCGKLGPVLSTFEDGKYTGVGACQLAAAAGIAALELGQREKAQASLDSMVKEASKRDQIAKIDIAVACATLGLASRFYSYDDGRELARAWAEQLLSQQLRSPVVGFAANCALQLLGEGASAETAGMLSAHAGEIVPFLPVSVDHISGLLALEHGNPTAALNYFDESARLARSRGLVFAEAHSLADRIAVAGKPDSRRRRRLRELAGSMGSNGVLERLTSLTSQENRPGNLTRTEVTILKHMAQGLTNQEIADRIDRTIYNVQSHAYNIFRKIEVSNRAAAIRWAIDHGLA